MQNAGEQGVVKGLFDAERWKFLLAKTPNGATMDCWHNVRNILEEHPDWIGVMGFDEFSQVPTKRRKAPTGMPAGPWMAQDDMALGKWLQQHLSFVVKALGNISTGVIACAQEHPFHPVREWLDGLIWDGTPRIEHFMHECFGAKAGPYASLVGRYFLLSMVARIFEPGCIMRSVPVLEGAQERGKSTALRTLAGTPWFSDSALDLSSKDAFELIQGVWLYEISEMHAFTRAEATKVKQFISSPKDSWVPKYIRNRVTCFRQVVFGGTTNESIYLTDWTGNTRFWPVLCEVEGNISIERIADWREQLFAEAVVLYRAQERRFPTSEEHRVYFEPEQAARLIEHPWVDVIAAWLDSHAAVKVTAGEVLHEACQVETSKMTLMMQQDCGRIMSGLGWVRKREPTGARRWFYERPAPMSETRQEDGDAPF